MVIRNAGCAPLRIFKMLEIAVCCENFPKFRGIPLKIQPEKNLYFLSFRNLKFRVRQEVYYFGEMWLKLRDQFWKFFEILDISKAGPWRLNCQGPALNRHSFLLKANMHRINGRHFGLIFSLYPLNYIILWVILMIDFSCLGFLALR